MRKINLLLILFLGGLLAGLHTVRAQEAELEERVTKLEKITSKLPRISGFVNLRYQFSDSPDEVNSFDVRRARLDFRGDISPSFDYRLHVEFANSPKILDAYFRWKATDYFNIQAGQYKIHYTLENAYGPHHLETIENSMSVSKLAGYNDVSGLSTNGRDIGLSFYGGFLKRDGYNLIDYAVGIFNGNGINTRDNNNTKDFSGILSINPIKHLSLAVSHYNGAYGPSGDTHQRVRTSGGIKYDNSKLLVRAEYLQGKTSSMTSQGYYGVVAYFVHPKVQPLLKYDHFREDKSVKETRKTNYIAGVNYFPHKNIRLQLNYTFKTQKSLTDINHVAFQVFGLF